jgi:hypothetical protein
MAIKHVRVIDEIDKGRKTIHLSSLKYKVCTAWHIVTDPRAGGRSALHYCLPADTSELELDTASCLISEETSGISVGDDRWFLLDDDFFCWCDEDDVFDRSLEDDSVSLSEEHCVDLACDVPRGGQCWRHRLLAMTRFWWSSCGNRPVTWYEWTW